MEYYGKILCISKEDLTRDDRPAVGGYQIDNTKAPIMTNECYKSLVKRGKIRVCPQRYRPWCYRLGRR